MTAPDGSSVFLAPNEENEVFAPRLRNPHGLGEQPLYTVRAEAKADGIICDAEEKRIGLRRMKLIREKERYGEGFAHECNGIRFFAMGADYIPEDNIFSKTSRERTYILLKRCVDANFNAVRIWGGGYYPENWFFDIFEVQNRFTLLLLSL
jgi:beta-mannosidase